MPAGIAYRVQYDHKRKEVTVIFRVGSMPVVEIIMGAEAFCQDFDYISRDQNLAKFIADIRERKDLPVDHDFGVSGGGLKFDPKEWEDKMEGN